jgi:FkbM family methyltransferase
MTMVTEVGHEAAARSNTSGQGMPFAGKRSGLSKSLQNLLIASVRPYVSSNLPGSGLLYRTMIGKSVRNPLWLRSGARFSRSKFHPFSMRLQMSKPADREAYFLKRWQDLATQVFARDLIRLGDRIVDIGAARGMFALHASYLAGPNGHVICFEPNPDMCAAIESDLLRNGLNNVDVIRKAAGDASGLKRLTVPRYDNQAGSFADLSHYGEAEAILLADVIPADSELEGREPALIKISVEGYETHVLRGLARTIRRCHPVIIADVSAMRLEANGSSAAEFVRTMASHGYLGFKIELRGKNELADWTTRPVSPADLETRTVWVHEFSPSDARTLILDRMVKG